MDPCDFEEEDAGEYEGKFRLKDEPEDEKVHEIELTEDERDEGEQAANGCPVFAIELVDKESGETIAGKVRLPCTAALNSFDPEFIALLQTSKSGNF